MEIKKISQEKLGLDDSQAPSTPRQLKSQKKKQTRHRQAESLVEFTFKKAGSAVPSDLVVAKPLPYHLKLLGKKLHRIKKEQIETEKKITKKNYKTKSEEVIWVKQTNEANYGSPMDSHGMGDWEDGPELKPSALSSFGGDFGEKAKIRNEHDLVQMTRTLEKMLGDEINRVLKLFSLKNQDQKTIWELERYLIVISSPQRTEFEIERFLKDKRITAVSRND